MLATKGGLRIGTFNTHLDSLMFEIGKDWQKFLMDPKGLAAKHAANVTNKAEQIADRILFSGYDYDVIALIEVFSEDARSVLLSKLSSAYPYRIEKLPKIVAPLPPGILGGVGEFLGDALGIVLDMLGIDLPDIGEDSGLMLFSRYPIVKTSFREFTFPSTEAALRAMPDSLAAKGAAYARIFNSMTKDTFNLVLTHLQENEEKWAGVRGDELNQIQALIRSVMTDEMIRKEDIFVVGDLNLNGNWTEHGIEDIPPKDILDNLMRELDPEWTYHFRNSGSFFTTALQDTWFYETSTKDEGHTSAGRQRIDYILHNPVHFSTPLRVQHLTKAYNLFSITGESLSDHFGLNADLNRDAEYCNPRKSRHLTLADGEYIPGELTYPGSMVWYRVDDPGTYSLAVLSSKDIEFAVYKSTDLSRPLGQYKAETIEYMDKNQRKFTAKKHVMVDPPYYIRVYHQARYVNGDYSLFIHKHRGVDKDDAIVLVPHKLYPESPKLPPVFKKGEAINPDDTVWFQFDTLQSDSGEPQEIVCEVAGYSKGVFRMTLVEADGKTIISSTGPDPSKLTLPMSDVDPLKRPLKVYLLVTRDDPTYASDTVTVKWTTNLTVFHGWQLVPDTLELRLFCEDETNPEPFGSDEIVMRIWVDGKKMIDTFVAEFEDGDVASLEGIIPKTGFRYLHDVVMQLYEIDHVSPDDPSEGKVVPILKEHRLKPNDEPLKFNFEDGEYHIQFNRSSWIPDS